MQSGNVNRLVLYTLIFPNIVTYIYVLNSIIGATRTKFYDDDDDDDDDDWERICVSVVTLCRRQKWNVTTQT